MRQFHQAKARPFYNYAGIRKRARLIDGEAAAVAAGFVA
jgi:hypothetical protein